MLFCIRLPNFIQMEHRLRKYDVISIFQDGERGSLILLPVSYLLMSLPSEDQNLSGNQISSNPDFKVTPLFNYKCKKLWFIHELTARDTSETAKITKR